MVDSCSLRFGTLSHPSTRTWLTAVLQYRHALAPSSLRRAGCVSENLCENTKCPCFRSSIAAFARTTLLSNLLSIATLNCGPVRHNLAVSVTVVLVCVSLSFPLCFLFHFSSSSPSPSSFSCLLIFFSELFLFLISFFPFFPCSPSLSVKDTLRGTCSVGLGAPGSVRGQYYPSPTHIPPPTATHTHTHTHISLSMQGPKLPFSMKMSFGILYPYEAPGTEWYPFVWDGVLAVSH